MNKNDVLSGVVDSLGYNGEGVLHVDGTTVFVPFVLPKEKITFKVLKVKKTVAYGKVESIETESSDRVTPRCPLFKKCGGCNLQHLSYEKQLGYKAETVKACFKKIAGLDVTVAAKIPSPAFYGYRNKMQLPVRSEKGENKIGFFRANSHAVIETDDCPLQPDWAKKVISSVKNILDSGVPAYDETNGKGLLRHVVVREINGEFLFTFVFYYQTEKFDNKLIAALSERFDKFSVLINVNSTNSNVILGDVWRKVYGSGKIEVNEFGITYPVNAASFFQVNTPVKKMIYESVLCNSGIDKNTVVIDAFSGAGVLTAMLAQKAKKAYGVEIIDKAVEAADELKRLNGVKNMENICAPCESALPELIAKVRAEGEKTVLVLDPPRSGADMRTILSIVENKPDQIVYISCSPQTLARDVGLIVGSLKASENGAVEICKAFSPAYNIDSVAVYDMFPQTKHVETLVCLSRQ